MAFTDTKTPAVDPDNPTADEQVTAAEWNAMVLYFYDRIIGKDVDATAIGNDKILVYKTATETFVFEDQNEITELNDIPGVTISGVPANDEILAYDSTAVAWINQTAAEAGLATTTQLTALETAAVLNEDFNAMTFLYATSDNTPEPKTPAEVMAILSGKAAAEFSFNTQKVGGIVDPTTAQQASTKNYADTHLYGKDLSGSLLDGYIPVYRLSSDDFEMEEQSAALGLPVADSNAIVKGSADGTKQIKLEVDGLTPSTTRTLTVQDRNLTICGTDEVMLLNGTQAMAGDLNMGDYKIDDIDSLQAYDPNGISVRNSSGTSKISLSTYTYSFAALEKAYMANYRIEGVGNPTYAQDAATKSYCDSNIGGTDATELTIASGAITITQSYHDIDTEGDAASDNLDTISGGTAGQILVIRAEDSARTVVAKHGTGNLQLDAAADKTLDNIYDTLTLLYDGTNWLQIGFSNNGA